MQAIITPLPTIFASYMFHALGTIQWQSQENLGGVSENNNTSTIFIN